MNNFEALQRIIQGVTGPKVLVIGPFLLSNTYFVYIYNLIQSYSDYLVEMSGQNEYVMFPSQNGNYEIL